MSPPPKLVAIAFSDFDGIGFEFYSTVVKPCFEKLREKEEAGGGSGSDARKKKSEFRGLPAERQHHDSQG
jgi:hypothetical protein